MIKNAFPYVYITSLTLITTACTKLYVRSIYEDFENKKKYK